uniref:Uncharacterized protein n=1 Tax=Romanomermis culicivorax TaxID=13658 RepID=A0A915L1F4_ROMCU
MHQLTASVPQRNHICGDVRLIVIVAVAKVVGKTVEVAVVLVGVEVVVVDVCVVVDVEVDVEVSGVVVVMDVDLVGILVVVIDMYWEFLFLSTSNVRIESVFEGDFKADQFLALGDTTFSQANVEPVFALLDVLALDLATFLHRLTPTGSKPSLQTQTPQSDSTLMAWQQSKQHVPCYNAAHIDNDFGP